MSNQTEADRITLTDFLLARITEDEDRAQFVASQTEGNNWTPFEPWRLSWHDEYDLLCMEPSRALAECEAKRRIVDLASGLLEESVEMDRRADLSIYDESGAAQRADATRLLKLLALPYADHADFQEAWRV